MIAALLLAFAAQTAGLGPDHPRRHDYFEQRFMVAHGGVLGESLYWAASTLFQRVGAHILALLMVVSGRPAGHRDDGSGAPRIDEQGDASRRDPQP